MKNTTKNGHYKGLLIKRNLETKNLDFKSVEIDRDKSLETLHDLLECDTIDIQERIINNKIYDFIIDDEYLLNGKSDKISELIAVGLDNGEILEEIYHSLIICGQANENGEETDITEEDIKTILNKALGIATLKNAEELQVIGYEFYMK